MLAAQRRDLLLERLKTEGRIVAKDLAVELDVSEDSIRRDLRELAEAGLCQRVYGGALPVSPATADYATRMAVSVAGKEKIALPADTSITGRVGIGPIPTGFGIQVELRISAAGVPRDTLQALVEKAHIVCPYSNATRGNIDVTLNVI